jgi:nitrous oxidase accessory protein NosD
MMAQSVAGRFLTIPGLIAGDSLAAKQYYAVKMASTDGEVIVAAAPTDILIGLVQNDPGADEPAMVACSGVAKGKSGASITIGQLITALSTGTLTGTSGGTASSQRVVGIALEAADSGDEFSVLVNLGMGK